MGKSKTRKSETRSRRKPPARKARVTVAKPASAEAKKPARARKTVRHAPLETDTIVSAAAETSQAALTPASPDAIPNETINLPANLDSVEEHTAAALDWCDAPSVGGADPADDAAAPTADEDFASEPWVADAVDSEDVAAWAPPEADDEHDGGFVETLAEEPARDICPPVAEARSNPSSSPAMASLNLTQVASQSRRLIDQPLPRITIHASCDRAEIAELIAAISSDRRMARAEITIESGGIEAATSRFASHASPNLLILDSVLPKNELLAALDQLADVIEHGTKVVIIGAVNDIALFRALMARGVSEYLAPPLPALDLIRTVCGLYINPEKPFAGRVIAVIGARGGIGASTIAHNLAWSIAERHHAGATLLDLDLSFGTAALDFNQDPLQSLADALGEPDRVDDVFLERIATKQTQRLQILTAPATLERDFLLDAHAFDAVIERTRGAAPFVVLDLPNVWAPWVKQTLRSADDVVIVASPDLASLRNTKNIIEFLNATRRYDAPPAVVLSMVGMPRRPEIPQKEFAEAVGAAPLVSLAFDPALFGMAANNGQMIGEIAPQSRSAVAIDALAANLTGRRRVESRPSTFVDRLQSLGVAAEDVSSAVRRRFEMLGKPRGDSALNPRATSLELPEPSDAQRDAVAAADDAPMGVGDYLARARRAAQAQITESPASGAQSLGVRGRLVALGAVGTFAVLVSVGYQSLTAAGGAIEPRGARAETLANQDPRAQYELAVQLIGDRRNDEAIALLQRAADAGFALAQYRLAKIYERGEGVAADLTLARFWTERAAAAGNRRAMHDLGVFFARGEGAPLDEAAAFRWFRQAAELGVADSQYNLGILYEQGRGVTPSATEALFWFLVAAGQGDRDAGSRATSLEAQLTPAEVEQARGRALAFRPRAADANANGELNTPPEPIGT